MKIEKILNNNVVVSTDTQGKEIIAMGRGLAYNKKTGDMVEEEKVDKVFSITNEVEHAHLYALIEEIPIEYWTLAHNIVKKAQVAIGQRYNDSIYISLADHLHSTVKRYEEGDILHNALLWDIQHFYPDEYAIGELALDEMVKELGIRLADDEIGFIGMHFVHAKTDGSLNSIYKMTQVMREVTNIVRYYFNVPIDEQSVQYFRYINHLRHFASRLVNGKAYENQDDEELVALVKRKYKNSFKCAEQVANFIHETYDYDVSSEEQLYLAIHIERLIYQ